MAFSDLGSLGATGSSANNQTSLVLTTSAAASAGELVVLVIGDDNIDAVNGNTNTAPFDGKEVASITDNSTGGPNKWHRAGAHVNGLNVAQAGASCQIWYSILDFAISNGGTITITFTNATLSDATAVTARHFSFSGTQVAIENTGWAWSNAADPTSINPATANIECLRIRGIAGEIGTSTSLTPTASWTAWANGNSATTGTTAEICVRAEHIISTGTSGASDPTWVACDNASSYVAFRAIQSSDTPHFVNAGIFLTNSAQTSIAPALPSIRKTGNLLLAFCGVSVSTTVSVSGTGWTLVETVNNGALTEAWAWCIVDGTEGTPSFSWAGSSNNSAIIFQFCNTDQTAPIGAHNNGIGNSATLAVSAVTTTRDNSLVVGILESRLADNCAPNPPNYNRRFFLTNVPTLAANIICCEQTVATSGSSSDAVSVSITSANWRGIIAEIKSPVQSSTPAWYEAQDFRKNPMRQSYRAVGGSPT